MPLPSVAAQLLALAAISCAALSFQAKRRRSILLAQMSCSFLWLLQNLCLGGWSGVAVNAVSVFRNWLYSKKEDWKWVESRLVPLGFMVAFLFAGLVTTLLAGNSTVFILPFARLPAAGKFLLNMFPTFSMLFSSFSFYVSEENRVRLLTLLGTPFFFFYNLSIGGYVGAAAEGITAISILIALLRYRKKDT